MAFVLPLAVVILALRGVLDHTAAPNSEDLDLVLYVLAGALALVSTLPLLPRR